MNIDQTISELNALPVPDRIRIIAAVWDSMTESEATLTTHEQDVELNRRLRDHRRNPESSLTRDELKQRFTDD